MNTNNPLSSEEDYKKSLVNTDVEPLVIPLDGGNSPESEEESQLKLYGFKLGDTGLLVENEVRREIVENAVVTPIPLMPDYVLGLCNVRGNLVPVYDLYKKLEIEHSSIENQGNRILVLGENEDMFGLLLQELLVSIQFDSLDSVEIPQNAHEKLSKYIKYCYRKDSEYWFCINFAELIESL